jgi:hypothetical protein
MSRPAFTPSSEQRGNVEAMIGYGITAAEICRLIKNPETGKAIDQKTLRTGEDRPARHRVTEAEVLGVAAWGTGPLQHGAHPDNCRRGRQTA